MSGALFRSAVCLLAMLVGGFFSTLTHAADKTVTIAEAARHMNYIPFYYAVERGYFKREGLDVRVFTANRRDLAMKAVIAGEAFASLHDPIEAALARSRGADVKIIASVVAVPLTFLVGDVGITEDPTSWRGKRVAVATPPNTNFSIFVKELKQSGWSEVDATTYRYKGDTDSKNYLRLMLGAWGTEMPLVMNGQANMAVLLEPGASTLIVKGGKQLIRDYPAVIGPMLFSSFQINAATIRAEPETVQRFVTALTKAYRDARSRSEDVVSVASKWFPDADPRIIQAAIGKFIAAGSFTNDAMFSKASYERNLEYFALGFPDHPALKVKWEEISDTSFAQRALAPK
jgi:NitT/TauT family transport system substrate-binding protein